MTFEEELEMETKRAFNVLCKVVPMIDSDLMIVKKRKVYAGIKRFDPNMEEVGGNYEVIRRRNLLC
jgi:hypothetical protein